MKEKIINFLESRKYHPADVSTIATGLLIEDEKEIFELGQALQELEEDFIIMHNRKNEFALLETFNMAKGIIAIKDAGYGFLDTPIGSIHINAAGINSAINGDEVLVRYTKTMARNRSYEGSVTRIIKRNTLEAVGTIIKSKGKYLLQSANYKINVLIFIKDEKIKDLSQVVRVRFVKFYDNGTVDAVITDYLGSTKDVGMDITTLVLASGVPITFSDNTKKEVQRVPQTVDEEKYQGRTDLRHLKIITIDGEDAKDLDDAVAITKLANGNYLLGVYIADVAEYVKEASAIDIDAFSRGTSIYLPDRVIPMLPKELSNGICSLNPGVERLVMAVEMEIDQKGQVVEYHLFEGIISTLHRMTYNNVNAILENRDDKLIEQYNDIYDELKMMGELAQILYQMRIKRGAFEFETSDAKLIIDENNKVTDIKMRERRTGERLIEEFMLIANETVAKAMTWLDVPFIYRVHEQPNEEKLQTVIDRIKMLNHDFKEKNKKSLPKALQKILIDSKKAEDEYDKMRFAILNNMLLRAMSKAKYQELNIGHFGLASDCYTHFTSPIRRYPDLLVHRLIKQFMFNHSQVPVHNPIGYFTVKVNETGKLSSKRERVAESLERDSVDMKKCEYMEKFVGKEYTGVISSITNWGLYVMLDNTVEGLIRFDDMHDDYYEIYEQAGYVIGKKNRISYQIGDRVKVKLIDVSVFKRQITFKMLKKE